MREAAYGSAPVRPAASNPQFGALTDVLHELRILTDQDTLLTVSRLLGRDLAALRALRRDEAENLLALLRVPLEAGLSCIGFDVAFRKG